MPRHLWLHIGLPKTGTTAIQRMLAARRLALQRMGICVPVSAGGAVPAFLHRVAVNPGNARVAAFAAALRAEIAALPAGTDRVILSAEQCSLALRSRDAIAKLHAMLSPLFSTVTVMVYLRRQDAHAVSLYGQGLRRGSVQAPDLAMVAREFPGFYDYDRLLGEWAAVFGAAAIVPRIFEPSALRNGDVVEDFFTLCRARDALPAQHAPRAINPSINIQGQRLLRGVRLQMENFDAEKWQRLANIVTAQCPGQGWRPARAAAEAFMAAYAGSNDAVRRTWFPDRPALFELDFSAFPDIADGLDDAPLAQTSNAVILAALEGSTAQD